MYGSNGTCLPHDSRTGVWLGPELTVEVCQPCGWSSKAGRMEHRGVWPASSRRDSERGAVRVRGEQDDAQAGHSNVKDSCSLRAWVERGQSTLLFQVTRHGLARCEVSLPRDVGEEDVRLSRPLASEQQRTRRREACEWEPLQPSFSSRALPERETVRFGRWHMDRVARRISCNCMACIQSPASVPHVTHGHTRSRQDDANWR